MTFCGYVIKFKLFYMIYIIYCIIQIILIHAQNLNILMYFNNFTSRVVYKNANTNLFMCHYGTCNCALLIIFWGEKNVDI